MAVNPDCVIIDVSNDERTSNYNAGNTIFLQMLKLLKDIPVDFLKNLITTRRVVIICYLLCAACKLQSLREAGDRIIGYVPK